MAGPGRSRGYAVHRHVNCMPRTQITLWLAGGIPIQLPIHLDETSSVPLRAQLCSQIRAMIVDGLLAPGSEVPSTRELSTQLHVARNTVVRAYEKLIAEGYLEPRSAAATFVSRVLPDYCTGVEGGAETVPPPYPPPHAGDGKPIYPH